MTAQDSVFCSGCMLTFIFLSMVALGVYTAGPTSSRDTSRHTPFYFVKESGCDRKQLPWFRSNYNMTLDDKGWQVMPGWAMCPVSGVYDSCPGCLPDPNGGGPAPTFGYTNCIYFSNDKFWASLDVIAKSTQGNSTTTFGPDAAYMNGPVQSMTLAALLLFILYPVIPFVGFLCQAMFEQNAYLLMLISFIGCVVLVGIATALWIASYIQITQTVFSSSTAYTRTLFRSCSVWVAKDSGSKIHLSCCVLSAITWGILVYNLVIIYYAYLEDRRTPPIDPALLPISPTDGSINTRPPMSPLVNSDSSPVVQSDNIWMINSPQPVATENLRYTLAERID